MGGAARARDDHAQAALLGGPHVADGGVGRAVGGEHPRLVGDPVVLEDARAAAHHGRVAVAAHEDRDERLHRGAWSLASARWPMSLRYVMPSKRILLIAS